MASAAASYSLSQRILHWLVVALVFFNLLLPEGMENWIDAVEDGGTATPEQLASANLHAYAGIAILALTLCRLALRLRVKVTPLPSEEPAIFHVAAKAAHAALYILTIALPLSGAGAYYFSNELSGAIHGGPLKLLLWLVIAAHVLGVLVHQFYWKTDILRRMTVG